jgi:transposase
VDEELHAGITALLAEPALTAHQRGPKKRAKTDKADARLLRGLVADGHQLIPGPSATDAQRVEYAA